MANLRQFLRPVFAACHVQHVSDLHLKLPLPCVDVSIECNGNLSIPQTFTADRTCWALSILWVHTFTHGLSHVSVTKLKCFTVSWWQLTVNVIYLINYHTQWTAEGSVFGIVGLWFFCLCMQYLSNRSMHLHQICMEDVLGPSLGRVWRLRSKAKITRDKNRHFSAFQRLFVVYV